MEGISPVASCENVDLERLLDEVEGLGTQGELSKGETLLESSKGLFERNGEQTYVRYLIKRGHFSIKRSRWNDARDYFKQAVKTIGEQPPTREWDLLAQDAFIGLGKMSWRTGMYLDAEIYLKRALEKSFAKDANRARIHIELANVLADKGEFAPSIENYKKAISILEPLGESEELTRAYNNIADTYMQMEDYESSLDNALKCIQISERIGNKRQESWGYLTGGEALVKLGYTDVAREYLEGCRAGFGNAEEDYLKGSLLKLEAMVAAAEQDFQGAKMTFTKAREHLEYAGIPYYAAQLDYEEAAMYKSMGNLSLAKQFYDRALSTFRDQRCKAEIKKIKRDLKDIEDRERRLGFQQ